MKKNYIYAFLSVFIWATNATVSKLVISDIPNLQALSVSSALAFGFLLLMNILTGNIKEARKFSAKDYLVMAGLGFLGLFVYTALFFYGLSQLSSQEANILNYLWPLMLVIFSSVILREKLTLVKWVAMICSFVGIVILSTGGGSSMGGKAYLGMLSCIIAAACYGLFSVLNVKANYTPNIAMMVMWLTTAICAAALSVFTETWVPIAGTQWLGVLWLGIVINAAAYLFWALALKDAVSTAKIANIAYLTPFLSLIVSAVVLKEKLSLRAAIALIFIMGGILLQSFYESFQQKRKNVEGK